MTVLPTSMNSDLLVAVTMQAEPNSRLAQSELNTIAVARIPADGGPPIWTIAAHIGDRNGSAGGLSKAIYSRPSPSSPLSIIGRLSLSTEIDRFTSSGPSLSSPAMDRSGNIYFISGVALNNSTFPAGIEHTTALLRANFNPSTNAYQLELLAKVGEIHAGVNSGRNYQIQRLSLVTSDSLDPSSVCPSSIVQDYNPLWTAPAHENLGSPFALGALAFAARIVYDTNLDNIYSDPTAIAGTTASPDQGYNVIMMLTPRGLKSDANRSGAVTVTDIFTFLADWFAGSLNADFNGSGTVTVTDIFGFLAAWFAGI